MAEPCAKRRRTNDMDHYVSNDSVYPDVAWNNDMDAFYNDSWGYDMDGVEEIQWSELSYMPTPRTKCMCGGGDHLISECPHAGCLKCGEKTDSFEDECVKCITSAATTCQICGYRGHSRNNCPYVWKYYHSIIPAVSPLMYSLPDDPCDFQFNWEGYENFSGFSYGFSDATLENEYIKKRIVRYVES